MAVPVLAGTGANLKKTPRARSNFWIVGTGMSNGNVVEIKKAGVVWWRGTIRGNCTGDKCRASVSYVGPEGKEFDDDDLATVDITVTNADGASAAVPDQVVVDGPDGPP